MSDGAGLRWQPASAAGPAVVCVIAELGVNHDGQRGRALALVEQAAAAGADAVKVQWFNPEHLLSAEAALATYQQGQATSARDLLARLTLSFDDMLAVRQAAHDANLAFIATLFSPSDASELAQLEPEAVKIASPDAVNLPLLERAAALGRPMLISTGTCDLAELEPAAALLQGHAPGGALLQCVSSYPTPPTDAALAGIAVIAERYRLPVGYSDHTVAVQTGALAVAAGACVLEKHFTLDRTAPGPDHAASLEPAAMREYVRLAREAAAMLGPRRKVVLPVEADVRTVSRQSLCATRDLPAGHQLAEGDLTVKRPGTGIPAAQRRDVIGRRLARPVRADHLLREADLA